MGAADGENVTLAGSGFFGLRSFTAAGKLEGSTLTLTGEQAIPLTFKRTSILDYQTQEAALNSRSTFFAPHSEQNAIRASSAFACASCHA